MNRRAAPRLVRAVHGGASPSEHTPKVRHPRNSGARPAAFTSSELIRRGLRRLLHETSHQSGGRTRMRRIASGSALLLFAVGCGSSSSAICDELGNTASTLKTKYSACGTLGGEPFNKDQCVEAYNNSHCSDAEKQTITDFVHCLDGMPTC